MHVGNGNFGQEAAMAGKAFLHPATMSAWQACTAGWRFEMKMLATKMALVTSVALATLLATEAAYAQRYYAAPQSYDAVDQSRVRDHRSTNHDQQIIDGITNNDWNAGK
jgi:hypothetical protein